MTTYINPFTGQTVSPSQVAYEALIISTDTILQWPVNGTTTNVAANIIDVTATTGGLSLFMPNAQQVSVGQAVIIRNNGSNAFDVKTSTGVTIVNITSSIAQYVYLTDNGTDSGTWTTITFGAGTSAANAGTLAGYGLTAIGATLNQAYNVINVFSSSDIIPSERAQFVVYEGGVGTLALPSASAVGNNWFCMIRNSGTGILTLMPDGTNTIDGNSLMQLQLTESLVLVSDGSNWNTFGYGQAVQFAFTQLVLSLTGGTLVETSTQASNVIQEYQGILTSNQVIVMPSTVQLYSVTNNTTGSYSLTVRTSAVGAATVVVPQSSSLILICDGTNVYNAASGSSSSITSLTLGNGSLAVPSLKFAGDTNTGLYLPATGQLGFVIANALAGYFDSTGLTVPNGISGGTF